MKYNDPIVLHENETHQMILSSIRRGSKVLEFGAASGRMTKLLSGEYGCEVYIVEYERAAFELAMQYAADGMCTDIETYQWVTWADTGFDYILFCDVLEHLKEPKKALKQTKELLKEDGSVFISLPNICHNDIFVKLYDNKFEYTEVGLLDDTHIHFFSERTLDSFVAGTGYVIAAKQYKTVPTGGTEQYWNEKFRCKDGLYRLLRERENGEVYQFVLELKKETSGMGMQEGCQKPLFMPLGGLIYYDRGDGFSQDDVDEITGYRVQGGEYEFKGQFLLDADVKRVRIDPLEGQLCQLVDVVCSLGVADIPHKVCFEGKELILNEDPQMIWEVPLGTKELSYAIRVRIDAELLAADLIRYGCCMESEKSVLENTNQTLEKEKAALESMNTALEKEKAVLENVKRDLGKEIEKIKSANKDLEKERALLENSRISLEEKLCLAEQKTAEYDSQLSSLEKELYAVYRSKSWRYTKILRKMNAWVLRR